MIHVTLPGCRLVSLGKLQQLPFEQGFSWIQGTPESLALAIASCWMATCCWLGNSPWIYSKSGTPTSLIQFVGTMESKTKEDRELHWDQLSIFYQSSLCFFPHEAERQNVTCGNGQKKVAPKKSRFPNPKAQCPMDDLQVVSISVPPPKLTPQ